MNFSETYLISKILKSYQYIHIKKYKYEYNDDNTSGLHFLTR